MTVALSTLTTLGVGGVPRRLIEVRSEKDLVEVTLAVWEDDEPWMIIGGGSNTVAADGGFDGTVVHVATRGVQRVDSADGASTSVRIRVQAGEPWDELVAHTVSQGWAGIEALSGIPGSSGAAPVQNIGAYGQEIASVLVAVDFLDYNTRELQRLDASELELGYRTSALKAGRQGLVVALELELTADPESSDGTALSLPLAYPQLATALGVAIGERVGLAELRRTVLSVRAAKGMVFNPADPDSRSAGSFFTNPIVSERFARSLPADAPRWLVADTQEAPRVIPLDDFSGGELDSPARPVRDEPAASVKLSAAWLIENSGVSRGFRLPGSGAAVSSKHTLAIVNTGEATATDIAELARFIQSRVQSEFGVILQPEPVLVGVEL